MKLIFNIEKNDVHITAKDSLNQRIAVEQWSTQNPKLDFIHLLLEEAKASQDQYTLIIAKSNIPDLTSYQIEQLSLYPVIPYTLHCKSTGTILRDNYKIIVNFKSSSGLPLGKIERNGPFAKVAGKTYTLINPIYESLLLIEQINQSKDKTKLIHLQKLKEILPFQCLKNDESLIETEVFIANNFTLRVIDRENFLYTPCFVDVDKEADEMVYLLNDKQQQQYSKQFLDYNQVKLQMQIQTNQFIVLPPRTKQLIDVVKSTISKSYQEKARLFANPHSFFKEALGESYLNEHEDLFVLDQAYASDRISHIGIWEPKTQVFLPQYQSEWFPQYCVGIPLDRGIIFMKPENIENNCQKIEQAIRNNIPFVQCEGQKIKATQENLKLLKETDKRIKKEIKPSELNIKEEKKEKNPPIVAIIKDNLDENGVYSANKNKRQIQDVFCPSLLNISLFPHQKEGLSWLQNSWNKSKRGVLLADDMGLGKTLQVLAFLAWLKELEQNQKIDKKPILIIASTGLLKNWEDEHNKHLKGPGLGIPTKGSDLKQRLIQKGEDDIADCFKKSHWVLTTYDSLARYESIFGHISWQVIVFDECQAIKNPSSYRTDRAKMMDADFSIGLTGTPVENRLSDLWCISDTLYPGLLKTYKEFKKRYEDKQDHLKELTQIMKEGHPPSFMLRRMKKDHIKGLTHKKEIIIEEQMPQKQTSGYDAILQKVQSQRYRKSMVAIQHLKSMSLAPKFDENLEDQAFIDSSARLIALFKILDEIESRREKVLIFLESRHLQAKLIPIIKRKYKLNHSPLLINGQVAGQQRKQKVDIFQNLPLGFDVMILSPKAGGTGLTLTRANNVIHLERWWNPAVEDQCSDRVYRIGQKKDVNIYIPMAIHPSIKSFDMVLHERLKKKRELSQKVIVPTKLDSEDYKEIFETTTGETFEDDQDQKDNFYKSRAWHELRYRIFNKYGHRCQKCGADQSQSTLHVDHIKPRSKYPQLELDPNNLQVLCEGCNLGKSNKHEDDYRP